MLDSKEPKWEGFQDFLKNEVRFASVMKQYPAEAADLFAACEEWTKNVMLLTTYGSNELE